MNTQILLILGVFLLNNKDGGELHIIKDYIKSMDIDPHYTNKKIKMAKKITPLLPQKYISLSEQAILYASAIVKILDIKNIILDKQVIKTVSIPLKDNKDRLDRIMTILQEESLNTDFASMGVVMNILVNMDKYKNMLNMITQVNKSKDGLKNNDDFMKLALSILGEGKSEKESQEMEKMIHIISLLSSPEIENKDTI